MRKKALEIRSRKKFMADNTAKWWIGILFCGYQPLRLLLLFSVMSSMAQWPHRSMHINRIWSNFTVIFYGWEICTLFDAILETVNNGQWTLKIHVKWQEIWTNAHTLTISISILMGCERWDKRQVCVATANALSFEILIHRINCSMKVWKKQKTATATGQ